MKLVGKLRWKWCGGLWRVETQYSVLPWSGLGEYLGWFNLDLQGKNHRVMYQVQSINYRWEDCLSEKMFFGEYSVHLHPKIYFQHRILNTMSPRTPLSQLQICLAFRAGCPMTWIPLDPASPSPTADIWSYKSWWERLGSEVRPPGWWMGWSLVKLVDER